MASSYRLVKVRILATGPSMSQSLADSFRGLNCIVVNDAYKLAPWAMALAAQDHRWWDVHADAREFKGRKFTANKIAGVEQLSNELVRRDCGSGVLALEVARFLGAREIELYGYDNRGTHYFGEHPAPLRNTIPLRFEAFEAQLALLGESLRRDGIKIVNMTPNSALECFERGC